MEAESYDCYNWIIQTEKYHLRKNDIINMKEGEKLDILVLDKDVFENIGLDIPLYHKYKSNVFFKDNKATFIKGNKDLVGTLIFTNYNISKKVELHVEYKKNIFHEMIDGKLKNCNCLSHNGDDLIDLENDNYRVGWKGPIISWKYINDLPNIYLADINDFKNAGKKIVDKLQNNSYEDSDNDGLPENYMANFDENSLPENYMANFDENSLPENYMANFDASKLP
jgi:hypothetical protein